MLMLMLILILIRNTTPNNNNNQPTSVVAVAGAAVAAAAAAAAAEGGVLSQCERKSKCLHLLPAHRDQVIVLPQREGLLDDVVVAVPEQPAEEGQQLGCHGPDHLRLQPHGVHHGLHEPKQRDLLLVVQPRPLNETGRGGEEAEGRREERATD